MYTYMLDTSVCIRFLRERDKSRDDKLRSLSSEICLSTIVEYELLAGAELSARVEYQKELAEAFMARLAVIDYDSNAAAHSANIRADLKRRGQMIGNNDLLIAGHARSLGLKLVTGNLGEFMRVEGLRCEDW